MQGLFYSLVQASCGQCSQYVRYVYSYRDHYDVV